MYEINKSYKVTKCNTVDNSISMSACTPISGTNELYTGFIGLLIVGEMFAAQQSLLNHIDNSSYYSSAWLITPCSSWNVCYFDSDGSLHNSFLSAGLQTVRPMLYLKSSVKITNNDGDGTIFHPYEIGL